MEKTFVGICTVLFVCLFVVFAHADLTTIGTATYLGNDYNLIYDTDGPFGPVTWFDYTNPSTTWQPQMNWVSTLGNSLTINLNPGVTTSVDWSTGWRLPAIDQSVITLGGIHGYEGPGENGIYSYTYGLNMVNSELGHLYYEALGNIGGQNKDGSLNTCLPAPDYCLEHTGPFDNLVSVDYAKYWLESVYSPLNQPWDFSFSGGNHGYNGKTAIRYAIAVLPGEVSVVPEPISSTLFLVGGTILGFRRCRKKCRK